MTKYKKIGLGTVQFGLDYGVANKCGKTNFEEVSSILNYSKAIGITTLDTAMAYGSSQKVLGEVGVESFSVVSKISCENIKNHGIVDQLLEELNTTSLYALLLHDPQNLDLTKVELLEFKERLRIKYACKFGYSVYGTDQLFKLIDLYGYPDVVQVPYSIVDDRFESVFPLLKKNDVEIHCRSVYLQGALLMNPTDLPPCLSSLSGYLLELNLLVDKKNLSSALLNYCISNEYVSKVFIGVENLDQLQRSIEGIALIEEIPLKKGSFPIQITDPSKWDI